MIVENASLSDDVLYKPLVTWTVLLALSCLWYMIQPGIVPMEIEVVFFVWIPCILILALTLYTLVLSSLFTLRVRYNQRKGFTGRRHPFTESKWYKITYALPILYVLGLFASLMTTPEITGVLLIPGVWIVICVWVGMFVYMTLDYMKRRKRRVVSRLGGEGGE